MLAPMATAARLPFDASHPHALALYCSDGRFTDAVEALLRKLGYPRLDTLTIPGGPALLEMLSSDFASLTVARKSLSFLVAAHHIQNVVLIAHQGCGYYRARFSYEAPEAIERRQLLDLRSAEKWVRTNHPSTDVAKFYARTGADGDGKGQVWFERAV